MDNFEKIQEELNQKRRSEYDTLGMFIESLSKFNPEATAYIEPYFKQIQEELRQKRRSEYYTLGMLIEELSKLNPKATVYIEPFHLIPQGFYSYRGYYEDLAIEYSSEGEECTVAVLLKWANSALGRMFAGYKGGSFLMEVDTPIWVSNYGETSQMRLADIEVLGDNWVYLKCVEVKD